jgi:hypothetical protein
VCGRGRPGPVSESVTGVESVGANAIGSDRACDRGCENGNDRGSASETGRAHGFENGNETETVLAGWCLCPCL